MAEGIPTEFQDDLTTYEEPGWEQPLIQELPGLHLCGH